MDFIEEKNSSIVHCIMSVEFMLAKIGKLYEMQKYMKDMDRYGQIGERYFHFVLQEKITTSAPFAIFILSSLNTLSSFLLFGELVE